MTRTTLAAVAVLLLSATAFIVVPAWQLLARGPFSWHVQQPAAWQGAVEAAVVAAIAAAVFAFAPRNRWLLVLPALAFALYLRRHAVDIPLLLDLFYIEVIIGLGAFIRRRFGLSPPTDAAGYLQAFTLGFLAWSLLAWSASACGAGSIGALRALTLLLALPAAFGGHAPFVVYAWRSLHAAAAPDRAWYAVFATWFAVLYARSKVAFGHDSLWYGLRAESVLVPGSTIFEPLGLVSPVHYFPKLHELFTLPMAGIGDASVVSGITIWLYVLVLLASGVLAACLGLPARARMPVLLLVATLPALANATTPKPDVAALLFVLLATLAAAAFTRTLARRDAAWMLACATLACLAKLTAIPYVGVLVLATLVAAWRLRGTAPAAAIDLRETRLAIAACVAALAVAALVTARTWWLTGMPTIGPDPLFTLWTRLGFELAEPAGTLEWTYPQVWSDIPMLLLDWWFRPQRMPHIVVGWTGNAWLWAALVALALRLAARRDPARPPRDDVALHWLLLALATTGAVLAIGVRYHARGSDGNYFLYALLPAILLSAGALFRAGASRPLVLIAALACLPAFAAFQAGYAFISGGWTPGTRAFDFDLGRNWKGLRKQRPGVLAAAGLGAIGTRLQAEPDSARSVGYAHEPASFWLPGRFEHLATIGFSRPEYLADRDAFIGFLRAQSIRFLVLPLPGARESDDEVAPAVRAAWRLLEALPAVERIEDRDYTMLDLRGWLEAEARGDTRRAPLR